MQLRDIKINGEKLTQTKMNKIVNTLIQKIKSKGFLTTVTQVNSSRIDIKGGSSGMSNIYATVDINKLGYNYRVNSFTALYTKAGYKRTNVLSWDQRVELNHIINDVLDSFEIKCTVQSRGFEVRSKVYGRVNYWDDAGGSFQPYHHDWIYETEIDAEDAIEAYYPEAYKRIANTRFNKKFNKTILDKKVA